MPIYEYEKGGKPHYYYAFEVKDVNGKRKTIKKRGFKGKTEARKAEAAARTGWERGTYIDPSKVTFGEYIIDWLKNKQDVSAETRITNDGHIKNHINPVIGAIPLQKVKVDDIEKLIKNMQDKGLSDGTVRKVFNLVQTCFKTAQRKELIIKNPFDLLEKGSKPRPSKSKVDYWTKEEVKEFFNKVEHRNKIMFTLAIYCGMRRGEILGLRWKDIDFETSQIKISQSLRPQQGLIKGVKTDAGFRSITVAPYVISELKKHRSMVLQERLESNEYNDHDLVVCQPDGNPVSLDNFTRFWKRIVKKTGVRYIRFHDLRHTCASLLLSAGTHPKIVQEMLGHASIKVTLDTYSHLTRNIQAEAAMALENILK